ncbi:MAG: YggS family pyridoxal phosphate-dependent enzyme, partial [Methylococcales bacterium]|nr:YggS family pyridoxal phosphate-dependent enzyme [Methylococcales bacterium]
ESYLQEALKKQQELSAFDITWHFIGPIQSNKTKAIAAHFSWVHSVDRLKIAKRLSEQRPAHLPALNICLQVNISAEATKSGVSLEELPQLINAVSNLPNIELRGVMAIPEPEADVEIQREPYRLLYQTVKQLNMPELDTFSFGMTGDLKAAIAEGSTIVRIGTALFGARSYQ